MISYRTVYFHFTEASDLIQCKTKYNVECAYARVIKEGLTETFIEAGPGRFVHRGTCRRHKLRHTSTPKYTQSLLSKNPGAPVGPLLPATTGLKPVDGAQPGPSQGLSSSWPFESPVQHLQLLCRSPGWPGLASAGPDSWERREGWPMSF